MIPEGFVDMVHSRKISWRSRHDGNSGGGKREGGKIERDMLNSRHVKLKIMENISFDRCHVTYYFEDSKKKLRVITRPI